MAGRWGHSLRKDLLSRSWYNKRWSLSWNILPREQRRIFQRFLLPNNFAGGRLALFNKKSQTFDRKKNKCQLNNSIKMCIYTWRNGDTVGWVSEEVDCTVHDSFYTVLYLFRNIYCLCLSTKEETKTFSFFQLLFSFFTKITENKQLLKQMTHSAEPVKINEVTKSFPMNVLSNESWKKIVKPAKKLKRRRFEVREKTVFMTENASYVMRRCSYSATPLEPVVSWKVSAKLSTLHQRQKDLKSSSPCRPLEEMIVLNTTFE